jgi:hypothetical protein
LITFSKSKVYNVINLARVNPMSLRFTAPSNDQYCRQYIALEGVEKPAICVMVGILMEDYTDHPEAWKNRGDHYDKNVSIVPITLEAERYIAAMCVVIGKDKFRATGSGTRLKISTKPGPLPYKCKCTSLIDLKGNTYNSDLDMANKVSSSSPTKYVPDFFSSVKSSATKSDRVASSSSSPPSLKLLSVSDDGEFTVFTKFLDEILTDISSSCRCTRRAFSASTGCKAPRQV